MKHHHTRRGVCVSPSLTYHRYPDSFNIPIHPNWVQSAKLFWHRENCFGPKLPCQLWVESLPMLGPAQSVGAPHSLRVASCISAALNPPPVSPCSPGCSRGVCLHSSACSVSQDTPSWPLLQPLQPGTPSSGQSCDGATASSPTQDVPGTQEGDSPLLFRDMTRQTHSQICPQSSPEMGHVTAINYLLTHPIILPTAQSHLRGCEHTWLLLLGLLHHCPRRRPNRAGWDRQGDHQDWSQEGTDLPATPHSQGGMRAPPDVKWLEQFPPLMGFIPTASGSLAQPFQCPRHGVALGSRRGDIRSPHWGWQLRPSDARGILHLPLSVLPPTLPPAGSKTPSIPSLTLLQPLSFLKHRDFLLPLSERNLKEKALGICDLCCALPGYCEDLPCSASIPASHHRGEEAAAIPHPRQSRYQQHGWHWEGTFQIFAASPFHSHRGKENTASSPSHSLVSGRHQGTELSCCIHPKAEHHLPFKISLQKGKKKAGREPGAGSAPELQAFHVAPTPLTLSKAHQPS